MKLKVYIIFAFMLCHAIGAYSAVFFPLQSYDLDYGEYTIEAYTDHSDYETPSFQTELNEEDDAKICHVFWHLFNITTINCHTTTNGKINTSYLQNFLEPPCLS